MLTDKQRTFVNEYLVDMNGTQAAIRAGYAPKTAFAQASRLLSNVKVAAFLTEAQKARSDRTEITQDMVLRELARIGFSDMRNFTEWGPAGVRLKDYAELTDDQAAAISEVSQTITEAGGSLKFKLHDKRAALVDIGRHLGMFTDKIEHSGDVTIGGLLDAIDGKSRGLPSRS